MVRRIEGGLSLAITCIASPPRDTTFVGSQLLAYNPEDQQRSLVWAHGLTVVNKSPSILSQALVVYERITHDLHRPDKLDAAAHALSNTVRRANVPGGSTILKRLLSPQSAGSMSAISLFGSPFSSAHKRPLLSPVFMACTSNNGNESMLVEAS